MITRPQYEAKNKQNDILWQKIANNLAPLGTVVGQVISIITKISPPTLFPNLALSLPPRRRLHARPPPNLYIVVHSMLVLVIILLME